jgi:hypothetical protein
MRRWSSCLVLPLAVLLAPAIPGKPCMAPLGVSPETVLAQAQIARRVAGTESVMLDPTGRCVTIAVRTPGTARLVELLLRGVEVPAEAVRFEVDSSALPAGDARRT